jgi:predicted transcriptional regulator
MTPAELKTLREANGISISWLAEISHVHERTVRYWESGKSLVPDDVAEWILEIDAKITNDAIEKAEKIKLEEIPSESNPVLLFRYKTNDDLHKFEPSLIDLPATAYAAILYKTRAILEKDGIKTKIVFMNSEDELENK